MFANGWTLQRHEKFILKHSDNEAFFALKNIKINLMNEASGLSKLKSKKISFCQKYLAWIEFSSPKLRIFEIWSCIVILTKRGFWIDEALLKSS